MAEGEEFPANFGERSTGRVEPEKVFRLEKFR